MARLVMVCERCGSPNVSRDALARWDAEAQEWSVSSFLDCNNCDDCDGAERDLEVVEWPEAILFDDGARRAGEWPFYVLDVDENGFRKTRDDDERDPRAVWRSGEWRVYFETLTEARAEIDL